MIALLSGLIFSFYAMAGGLGPNVVYGTDDRKDLYQVTNYAHLLLASSTATIIKTENIFEEDDGYRLKVIPLRRRNNYCSTERFLWQNSIGECSSFLVGPDLIATAGHCFKPGRNCENISVIFNYSLQKKNEEPAWLPHRDVYKCKEVVTRKFDASKNKFLDHALIRLDRPVEGREPLKIRRRGQIKKNEPLVMIGNPIRLPIKVADNAKVRLTEDIYFRANLDAYGGNSGSAVFNDKTYEVEGILIRGETDFKTEKGCLKTNYCKDDACGGEAVAKIKQLKKFIPEL